MYRHSNLSEDFKNITIFEELSWLHNGNKLEKKKPSMFF